MQEGQSVSLVLALLSLPDIIHDHVSDFLHAVLLLREILSEGGGGDFGQMLMLSDWRGPVPLSSRIMRRNLPN
jgi:hypothetical protein